MVKVVRGNLQPPHGLLFPINSKGSFICTIPQTGEHKPRPLLHQSWSTGWNDSIQRSPTIGHKKFYYFQQIFSFFLNYAFNTSLLMSLSGIRFLFFNNLRLNDGDRTHTDSIWRVCLLHWATPAPLLLTAYQGTPGVERRWARSLRLPWQQSPARAFSDRQLVCWASQPKERTR